MLLSGNDSGAINTLLKSETGSKLLAEAKKFGSRLNSRCDIDDKEETTETLIHELLLITSAENCNSTKENPKSYLNEDPISKETNITFTPHDTGYWDNQTNKSSKASKLPDKNNNIMATINALELAMPKRTPANINPMQMVTQFIHKMAQKKPQMNLDQPVYPFASESLNYTA